MALTKISTGGVKDDAASQAKIADEAVDEARLQISNAGTNGQFLSKQSGNTGGLTWSDGASEGTEVKSTGESGTAKFLRVDGDGTCSWQVPPDNNTVYTHPNHSGEVTSTGDGATVIADNIVDEANLKVSNTPTNGQFLSAQSGNTGGLTWANVTIPPAGNTIDLVADGAIAAGKPVIIKSNGKAAEVKVEVTNLSTFTSGGKSSFKVGGFDGATYQDSTYDEANDGIWVIYPVGNASNRMDVTFFKIQASVGGRTNWVSNTNATSVEATVDSSTSCTYCQIEYDPDTQRTVALWVQNGAVRVKVLQYNSSNNTITQGSQVTMVSGNMVEPTMFYDTGSNKIIAGAVKTSDTFKFYSYVGTVTGGSTNSISFGNVSTTEGVTGSNVANEFPTLIYDPDNDKVVLYSKLDGGAWSNDGVIHVGTVSSNAITWNTATNIGSSHWTTNIVYDPNVNKFLVWFGSSTNSDVRYTRVITISGTSVSSGTIQSQQTATGTASLGYGNQAMTFDPLSNKIIFLYFREDGGRSLQFTSGAISGTSITLASPTTLDSTDIFRAAGWTGFSGNYTKQGQHIFFIRQSNAGTSNYFYNVATGALTTNQTNGNFIGFAQSAISDTNSGTIQTAGSVSENQSGLTPASRYYVKDDGTLTTDRTTSTSKGGGVAIASDKLIIDTIGYVGSTYN